MIWGIGSGNWELGAVAGNGSDAFRAMIVQEYHEEL